MEQTSNNVPAPGTSAGRDKVSLTQGRGGILGVKAGMTQVYNAEGALLAVTVIQVKPNVITQVKNPAKNGYSAIQIGFLEKKASKASRPEKGHLKASASDGFYHYQEFRLASDAKMDEFQAGKELSTEFLKAGDYVDLTAMSKGKGFQGGMKRFHMSGGHKTHGASVSHRSLGSIGNRADPGKCFKLKKMPGQMGFTQTTIQNLKVVRVDLENQLILVHGSVPGPRSGVITIRKAIKG